MRVDLYLSNSLVSVMIRSLEEYLKIGRQRYDWVAVQEVSLSLSYHNLKTILFFTIYPYYGNLNYVP